MAEQQHKQIKLEDIERDNLISEHKVQHKEILQTQQTQHIRPPHIHNPDDQYQVIINI